MCRSTSTLPRSPASWGCPVPARTTMPTLVQMSSFWSLAGPNEADGQFRDARPLLQRDQRWQPRWQPIGLPAPLPAHFVSPDVLPPVCRVPCSRQTVPKWTSSEHTDHSSIRPGVHDPAGWSVPLQRSSALCSWESPFREAKQFQWGLS